MKLTSDMKVYRRSFYAGKKIAAMDIHQHLINVYGDQTRDVSILIRLVIHVSIAAAI